MRGKGMGVISRGTKCALPLCVGVFAFLASAAAGAGQRGAVVMQRSERQYSAIPEVCLVQQDLAPVPAALEAITEAQLASRVNHALACLFPGAQSQEIGLFSWQITDPNRHWMIDVEVDRGVVILNGDVTSRKALMRITRAARSVPGVRGVDNFASVASNLSVSPGGR